MINKKSWVFIAAVVAMFTAATAGYAAGGKFSVKADELEYNLRTGEGTAKGNVVLEQDNGRATASYATFNSKTKSGTLVGNVIADQEDAHIECQRFIISYENSMSAVGNASLRKGGRTVSADRIDYNEEREYAETIGSWARLSDTDGSVLKAEKLDYDMRSGTANATGGVVITSEARKLDASADRAIYKTDNSGYIELIGNARAVQDGNSVSGDSLKLTNTKYAVADGNVKIYYIPEEKTSQSGNKQA